MTHPPGRPCAKAYYLPTQKSEGPQKEAQGFSAMLRLQVFYSLLYVVVEGYKELGCTDASVNQLLTESSYVEGLRKFRNANFHYQEDPYSPKLVDFMIEKGSEIWVENLYAALDAFFTSGLKLKDVLQSLENATRDSPV
jgi:hypothetical protein